jgi:cytochrome b561
MTTSPDTTRAAIDRWNAFSIGLHWLVFVLVLGNLLIGLTMGELDRSMFKVQVYMFHKSLGITVLALTAVRLLWRLTHRRPPPLPGEPRWQRWLAGLVHFALYYLLIAVPLSGWVYNSLSDFPLRWFWLFPIPSLAGPDRVAAHAAEEWHELLAYTLAGLVFVHAAAALAHHYLWRDTVLLRMLPARFSRNARAPTPGDSA